MSQKTSPAARRPALIAVVVVGAAALVLFARAGTSDPAAPQDDREWAAEAARPPSEVYMCAVRAAARRIVARDVIAGRVSVAEAASVFAALNDLPPRSPFFTNPAGFGDARGPDGKTDEKLVLGLQVVQWVGVVAGEDDADRARELTATLERQVRAGAVGELTAVREPAFRDLLAAADAEVMANRSRLPESGRGVAVAVVPTDRPQVATP